MPPTCTVISSTSTSPLSSGKRGTQRIEKGRFKSLVKEFTGKGVLDEALLSYLFIDYPQFDYEVALALLQHFHILHGPVKHKRRTFYIMPFFSSSFMGNSWKTDKDLQLRIDLEIRGLSIPWYVFQLVTVAVLNDNPTVNFAPFPSHFVS